MALETSILLFFKKEKKSGQQESKTINHVGPGYLHSRVWSIVKEVHNQLALGTVKPA